MKALALIAVLALAGCVTAPPAPTPVPQPAVQKKESVDIDRQLLVDCPTVNKVPAGQPLTKQQLLELNSELIVALSTCWHRQHDLATVAASAFNLTVPTTNIVNKQ